MRSAPLAPDAVLPAGTSPTGTTVHDLPVVRPAAVDCGWPPVLLAHLASSRHIRGVSRTGTRLRTSTVELLALLRPTRG